MEQAKVLITECYSPRNLGDGELVDASIDKVVRDIEGQILALVAFDTEGVSNAWPDYPVVRRLFDRSSYASASGVKRLRLVAVWAIFILTQSTVCLGPQKFRKRTSECFLWTVPASIRDTARLYIECSHIVPVGGGYLGDKYFRESVLTTWSWWWSSRLGKSVITMPMSVEASSRKLKAVYRLLLRSTPVVARDSASLAVLESAGVSTKLIPDLAFRNSLGRRSSGGPRRRSVVIVPVGSDYYAEEVWKRQLTDILRSLTDFDIAHEVCVYSMHQSLLDSTQAGFDAEASRFIIDTASSPVIDLQSAIGSYADLCNYLRANASLLITARMHAGIAGLCADVPLVMLGYEEKHRSLMTQLGIEDQYGDFGSSNYDKVSHLIEIARHRQPGVVAAEVSELALRLQEWDISK